MATVARGRRDRTLLSAAPFSLLAPGATNAEEAGTQQWFFGAPFIDLADVTPGEFDHAQTGIVLTGSLFEASQGAGLVELGDSSDYATATKATQTVTAWADTSITITANLGALGPGIRWLFVTNNTGQRSEGRPVTVHRAAAFTFSPSANISASGADATTARLTAPTGRTTSDFDAGRRIDDSATAPSTTTTTTDYTEDEWAVEATAAAVATEVYEFRVVKADGSLLADYAVTPEWTVSAGGGPVAGSTTAPLAVAARITGTKVAGGSTRAATGVTARPTGSKVAGGSVRALAGVIARVTGAPVSSTVAGSAQAVLGVVARVTGTKVATGSTRPTVGVIGRATTTKVATGAARAVATAAGQVSSAKIAGGAGRVLAGVTARATGTKTTVAGSARAAVSVAATATATKLATAGAVRTVGAVIVRVSSTPPGVVAGSARAALAVVARVSGTKVAGGAGRAGLGVAGRATAVKVAAGGAQAVAVVVARVAPLKRAGGAVVAAGGTVVSAGGAKAVAGSARAVVAVIARTPSRAPTELWSWYLRRGATWQPASPKLGGVHPTTADVT